MPTKGTEAGGSQLVWFDRTGKQLGVPGGRAVYREIQLSPDGKQVSVSLPDQSERTRNNLRKQSDHEHSMGARDATGGRAEISGATTTRAAAATGVAGAADAAGAR